MRLRLFRFRSADSQIAHPGRGTALIEPSTGSLVAFRVALSAARKQPTSWDAELVARSLNRGSQLRRVVPHISDRRTHLPSGHFLCRVGPEQIDWRSRRVEWS